MISFLPVLFSELFLFFILPFLLSCHKDSFRIPLTSKKKNAICEEAKHYFNNEFRFFDLKMITFAVLVCEGKFQEMNFVYLKKTGYFPVF